MEKAQEKNIGKEQKGRNQKGGKLKRTGSKM